MVINKITIKRVGAIVKFDDYDEIILNNDVVNKNGLYVGAELSEENIKKLKQVSAEIEVKTKAFLLLARRSHSVSELKNKLLKKHYDENIISKILSQLKQDKYLDDRKFALLFAEEKIKKNKQSINKTKSDLFKRGVSKTILNEIVEKYQDDDIIEFNIKALADKKILFLKHKYSNNEIIKNKTIDYLYRKGFEIEKIKAIVN